MKAPGLPAVESITGGGIYSVGLCVSSTCGDTGRIGGTSSEEWAGRVGGTSSEELAGRVGGTSSEESAG